MLKRRALICGIGLGAMSWSLASFGQVDLKARVGWLAVGPIASNKRAFLEALRQRGYVEGSNLVLEERYASDRAQLAQLTSDLLRLNVDVLVTTGGLASQAAKTAGASVPIVFLATDPIRAGLVTSLNRPAANLTGIAINTQDFNAKRVETLAGMIPGVTTLAALSDASGALVAGLESAFFEESAVAAKRLGIEVVRRTQVRNIEEVERAFVAAAASRVGGMLTISSSYFNVHKDRIISAAAKTRMPTIYEHRDYVEAGGLISYGTDLRQGYQIAALYVDRIVRGTKPADLPVEQISRVELVINQTTAASLGIALPPALRLRADQIIG